MIETVAPVVRSRARPRSTRRTASPRALLLASLLVAVAGLFHPTLLAHHATLLPAVPGQASAAFYLGFDLGIGLGSGLLGWTLAAAGVVGLYAAASVVVLGVLPLVPVIARQHPGADPVVGADRLPIHQAMTSPEGQAGHRQSDHHPRHVTGQ